MTSSPPPNGPEDDALTPVVGPAAATRAMVRQIETLQTQSHQLAAMHTRLTAMASVAAYLAWALTMQLSMQMVMVIYWLTHR